MGKGTGKRKNGIRAGALLVCAAVFMTGCGSRTKAALPELEEPLIATEFYRPAAREYIGEQDILMAVAESAQYGYSFPEAVTVTDIAVEIGDRVEKGDVLAYVGGTEALEEYGQMEAELALADAVHQQEKKMQELLLESLAFSAEGEELQIQYKKQQENNRYENQQYERQRKESYEKLQEKREQAEEYILRADHSGRVTYRKNHVNQPQAEPDENIAVIAADESLVLALCGITAEEYTYSGYELCQLDVDGTYYDVQEKKTPGSMEQQLECPRGVELEKGRLYPVIYRRYAQKALCIGNDSIRTKDGERYIYVSDGNGGKEKRHVKFGRSDEVYTEVTEGLEEGELVYYEAAEALQQEYESIPVQKQDFCWQQEMFCWIGKEDEKRWVCTAPQEGVVHKLALEEGDYVHRGDLLAVLETSAGTAALTETRMRMEEEEESFRRLKESYGVQRQQIEEKDCSMEEKENERQQLSCREEIDRLRHESALRELEDAYGKMAADNDGTGKVSVYAASEGYVHRYFKDQIVEGTYVQKNQPLLGISGSGGNCYKLKHRLSNASGYSRYPMETPRPEQKVTICIENDGEEIRMKGICRGIGDEDDPQDRSFYVEPEEENEKELAGSGQFSFRYLDIPGIIAIPQEAVFTEADGEKERAFVWCEEEDMLVKRYISIDRSLRNDGIQVVYAGLAEGDVVACWK